MAVTIPASHSIGDTGHTTDHDSIVGALSFLTGVAEGSSYSPSAGTKGQAFVFNSSAQGIFSPVVGTRPEWFGTITGSSGDDVAIQAAINAVNTATAPGPVVITQPCAISNPLTLATGVNLTCIGQGNRQVGPPDTFAGGYIFPASNFSDTALIKVGTAGSATTNPNGAILNGVCLSGYNGSTYVTNCIGVLITDTTDVHMTNCFLANFDRTGATGTCVSVTSATSGNGYGFCATNCIFSASWQGVYTTGAGVTDMRFSGNLWHSNTEALTIGGSNLGGGGTQITNDHFTYSGMPSTGWHFQNGSQAGDYTISNNYFDQGGAGATIVQLANAKGVFSGNHFLANSASSAATLVKLSTSGSQQITFCNNDCNGNGSNITSLFQTTAHSGAPTGGVYVGNAVYGTATALTSVLIDSGGSAITAANSSSLYVQGNVQFT
jgi:hypothetical protein